MYNYGGERDYNKFQIYFATPPSVESDLTVICYHCNTSIFREEDEKYIIVAAALQRPLYLHILSCYEGLLQGMVLFFNEVICKQNLCREQGCEKITMPCCKEQR